MEDPKIDNYIRDAEGKFVKLHHGIMALIHFAFCFVNFANSSVGWKIRFQFGYAVILLLTLPLYYSGWKTFAKIIFLVSLSANSMVELFYENQVISAVLIFIGIKNMGRYYFIFQKKMHHYLSLLTLLFSLGSLCGYLYKVGGVDNIPLLRFTLPQCAHISIILLIAHMVDVYFDEVYQGLFYQLQKYSAEVEQNANNKQVFFACMSHEVRSPLQSILGSVELLKSILHDERGSNLLAIMKECCDIVLNMISNILDFSKIDAHKMDLSPIPTDVKETVHKVVRMLKMRAENKGITLSFSFENAFPQCVQVDPSRFTQVVMNTVSNAVKFTTKGKVAIKLSSIDASSDDKDEKLAQALSQSSWKDIFSIGEEIEERETEKLKRNKVNCGIIECASKKTSESKKMTVFQEENKQETVGSELQILKIEVMDSGIGMSKEGVGRLFQPFNQAENSTSRNFGGTGLGLWISRKIVQLMGGDIRVFSKPDRGSNIVIAFPAIRVEEVDLFRDNEKKVHFSKEIVYNQHCVVVEDAPHNITIFKHYLEGIGMIVHPFNDCNEALKYYCNHRDVKLVITDLRMQGMSGQTLIMEIRKHEQHSHRPCTPIIIVTAESSTSEKTMCLGEYGANDYLVKPIRMKDLTKSIEKVFQSLSRSVKNSILIIDDDFFSSKVIATLLGKLGHSVKRCATIAESRTEIEENYLDYDLILLDSQLPDGSGRDFMIYYCDLIHQKGFSLIPIISLSGNNVEVQSKIYSGLPVSSFLEKPVSKALLESTLRALS